MEDEKRMQPFNISVSWTQPSPVQPHWVEQMNDIQLEILIQDMLFVEEDNSLAREMLDQIGIRT